jgi:type IV secretion system protein VirB10
MNDGVDLPDDEEPAFELTPEQATSLENTAGAAASFFNRKRFLTVICCALAGVVFLGVLMYNLRSSNKPKNDPDSGYAQARSNNAFFNSLRDSGLKNSPPADPVLLEEASYLPKIDGDDGGEPLLPPVSITRQNQNNPPPQQQPQQNYQQPPAKNSFYESPLVPAMQGSLFAQNNFSNGPSQNSQNAPPYSDYLNSLNNSASSYADPSQPQGNAGNDFYRPANNAGAVYAGQFLGEDAVWTGTVIPGILITSINTDLPGQVLARVTQNVYDSRTGRSLLIPQGSVLVARYDSSVSYAQSRVQIIWDVLIRPDGFQISLEGADGVDRAGMSGQEAGYKGNFFEYVKAAGIISLFSIANAKLTETVNKYGSNNETAAANLAESNAQFFNQLGSSLASQAMNVSPTLTVDNGALINIMLNKTLYLPKTPGYPPGKKYVLE